MFRLLTRFCLMAIAAAIACPAVGQCEDTLKLAVGAPNNWDSGVPEIGRRAGIFQKHGLNLELLYTSGGGETVQAVISGSVESRNRRRRRRRARRIRQGCTRSHPSRGNDGRERSLLVRTRRFAAQKLQ